MTKRATKKAKRAVNINSRILTTVVNVVSYNIFSFCCDYIKWT